MTKGKNMEQSAKNYSRSQRGARSSLLKLYLMGTALVCVLTASAQTTTSTNFTVGTVIPDGDKSGLVSAQTISTPITNLTGLKVALKVSGTWNGDLYCFLAHGSNHSVLLNRLGRGNTSNLGYNDLGLDLIFDDAATNGDIHLYRLQLPGSLSGALTDSWAPDARVTSPANVLDTDSRSAFLSSFNGVDPNGEWVLFVADLEAGDIHFLDSWGLEITGDIAPSEPEQSLAQNDEAATDGATISEKNQAESQVAAAAPVAPALLKGITASSGRVKLTFSGSAASTYAIERAASLQSVGRVWTNIGSATTDAAGQGEFTDTNPPAGQGYYRTVSQ